MKFKVDVSIFIEYEKYPTKKMNLSAKRQIRAWIKYTLNNEAGYIPFYVEQNENGSIIEACTRKTKIKLKNAR